jgi:hypothetical protein
MNVFDLSERISVGTMSVSDLNEAIEASITLPVREHTLRRSIVIRGFMYSDGDEAMNDTFMVYEPEMVSSVMMLVGEWGVQVNAKVRDQDVQVSWTITVTLFQSEAEELANVR